MIRDSSLRSQQRASQNQCYHTEIDHEARYIHQGRNERGGSAGQVEPEPSQNKRQHGSGEKLSFCQSGASENRLLRIAVAMIGLARAAVVVQMLVEFGIQYPLGK